MDEQGSERLWTRVSLAQSAEIEERAQQDGLNKSDWIRRIVSDALLMKSAQEQVAAQTDHVSRDLCHRIDQLETRMFHENSAMIHLGLTILMHTANASAAAQAGAASTGFFDEEGAKEMRRTIELAGQGLYERAFAELKTALKDLRDKAKEKANDPASVDKTASKERKGHE